MGGGGTQTSTQSTAPNNPAVDKTTTQLLTGLQNQYASGSKVFGQSLQPGAGDTTQQSWASMLGAANNPAYNQGISGAISNMSDVAAGNIENDAVRQRIADDAGVAANATFTNSGRFGAESHRRGLGEGIAGALAQHDYGRQASAMAALPGLYSASMAPAGVQAGVGAAQDANALALRQGEADLFDRQNNKGWNDLARATSILAGNAGASGSTTTTTKPETPWWQSALGLAGQFI